MQQILEWIPLQESIQAKTGTIMAEQILVICDSSVRDYPVVRRSGLRRIEGHNIARHLQK